MTELSQGDLVLAVQEIRGCTFATLSAETRDKGTGIRCVTTGENVLLFASPTGQSGYETMVKKRLREEGLNADNFTVNELPWGERIGNSPLIAHRGELYLQCVVLKPGEKRYFLGKMEVDPKEWGLVRKIPNQGLPSDKAVIVSTYKLSSLRTIQLGGNEYRLAA